MTTPNYKELALEAVDGMQPNSKRTAHYRVFNGSPVTLLKEILSLSQVDTARLRVCKFNEFFIVIETK